MKVVYYYLECFTANSDYFYETEEGGIGATLFFYRLCFQYLPDLSGNSGHIERFLDEPVTPFVHDPLCLIV